MGARENNLQKLQFHKMILPIIFSIPEKFEIYFLGLP